MVSEKRRAVMNEGEFQDGAAMKIVDDDSLPQ